MKMTTWVAAALILTGLTACDGHEAKVSTQTDTAATTAPASSTPISDAQLQAAAAKAAAEAGAASVALTAPQN